MIKYEKRVFDNGLTVLVNRDNVSKLAAINILYRVGARNEEAEHTGFAHLFEHLMFRGTERFPDFDRYVQMACGENNAFTNNDYTDFYITLPKGNIATALMLESDRMCGLNINESNLSLEKRVVIEEFKQCYLNQPYGDQQMLLRDLAYKVHPYRWSTIGLSPDHIEKATLEQVESFYNNFYTPSNAILSISADIPEEEIFEMCHHYFDPIESRQSVIKPLPIEPEQTEQRRLEVNRDVPATVVTIAFHIGGRFSDDFFTADLISDVLAGGESGRMYQHLVKERKLFASVNAYLTGEIDPGLFIFTGQLLPSTSEEEAEAALWDEIQLLKSEAVSDYELEKVKNKFEANTLFGEINVMNKSMNLGFYQMASKLDIINSEVDIYRTINAERIFEFSHRLLTEQRSNTLIYRKKSEGNEQ
ncbi:MAG: pitrilysin family protein [Rikenellaceae bacterium]